MRAIALIVAFCSAVLACPTQARDRAFYVGGDLGLVASSDMDLSFTPGTGAGSQGRLSTDHDPGFIASGLVGYDFGRLRVEAEASHLTAGVDGASSDWAHPGGLVAGDQAVGGDARAQSLLANVLLDFGGTERLSFFVGAGAGRSRVRVSDMALPQGGSILLDDEDDDWRSTWQAIAGARMALSDRLEGHVRYRYFEVDDMEMVGLGGRVVQGNLAAHSVAVGVTYRF